ncbi:hypothetical protein J1N35_038724 [Gossypium stocksii]|uniref:RNase H type-1 domain-containing protein n=1 Tax=Gossypium stocksii TaxID=47602 RepID=A0A9D3UN07_9ROSI|nr:hypothetical protein J1N35_038724 [Gossypium stocksii]
MVLKLDSIEAIQLLKCSPSDNYSNAVARDIQNMLKRNWVVNVKHVYREGNRITDALASSAFNRSLGLRICTQPPEEAFWVLHDDM